MKCVTCKGCSIFLLCTLCVSLFIFTGCDFIYGLLDKKGAQEKKLVGNSTPFERNPKIEEIQKLLNLYGYEVGKTDGILGARTRKSIVAFQRDNGLEETRFVDHATWQKLKIFEDNELVVNKKINIKLVQKLLSKAGFGVGNIDGSFGPSSKDALKSFQKKHGLDPDGRIGYKTLMELTKYLPQ